MTASTMRTVLRQALRRHLAAFVHRSFQVVSPGNPYRHNWHIEAHRLAAAGVLRAADPAAWSSPCRRAT